MWKIAQPSPKITAKKVPTMPARREHPQQQEDDLAGIHVPEEPQRMRQRLRDVFDEVEQEIERPEDRVGAERGAEELVDESAAPFTLIAKPIMSAHTESASAKVVFTSAVGTTRKPCSASELLRDPRHQVRGKEVHRVHQQHPQSHRERERRHELVAVAVEDVPHVVVDEAEEAARRRPGVLFGTPEVAPLRDPPEEADPDEAQDDRRRSIESTLSVQKRALAHRLR